MPKKKPVEDAIQLNMFDQTYGGPTIGEDGWMEMTPDVDIFSVEIDPFIDGVDAVGQVDPKLTDEDIGGFKARSY